MAEYTYRVNFMIEPEVIEAVQMAIAGTPQNLSDALREAVRQWVDRKLDADARKIKQEG